MARLMPLLLAGFFLCACAPQTAPADKEPPEPPYRQTLEAWTRNASVYNGLDSELLVSATLKSLPFRMQYAKEYARVYLLPPEEAEKVAAEQAKAWEMYLDFTVGAFVPQERQNDFGRPRSTWKVYLENGAGTRVQPLEIRPLLRDRELTAHFYPYMTPWKKAYVFRFPHKDAETGKPLLDEGIERVSLVITGPAGACAMTWEKPPAGWTSPMPAPKNAPQQQ
ncbi:MAG: hypothetical protein JRI97_03300 [Deltaproteobacteria bacterium]|nr:hypothetical protein [Deltaproteobacteria bacterium]